VSWSLGHLATLKKPEDYDPALKRWSLHTLPIVPAQFGLKFIEERGVRKQFEGWHRACPGGIEPTRLTRSTSTAGKRAARAVRAPPLLLYTPAGDSLHPSWAGIGSKNTQRPG
jgi:hypothetical protein